MKNDPRDKNGKKLINALYKLGRDEKIRIRLINFLKDLEQNLSYNGSKREEIVGPIVDALHGDDDTYEKLLSDGTKVKFFFRTKIARDFLLSTLNKPSHVWEPQTTKLLLYLAENLNDDIKNTLEGAIAVHDFAGFRDRLIKQGKSQEEINAFNEKYPMPEHPVIRTHPDTKKKVIYVNRLGSAL